MILSDISIPLFTEVLIPLVHGGNIIYMLIHILYSSGKKKMDLGTGYASPVYVKALPSVVVLLGKDSVVLWVNPGR